MKRVSLKFKKPRQSGYEILIQSGLLASAGSRVKRLFPGHSPFVISSPSVARHWGRALRASLNKAGFKSNAWHLVPDGEANKTFRQFERCLAALAAFGQGAAVKPVVILLGGGVIGDLGGFAASCYKRGLPFVQIPTTLLSMVDSSVGGKLGVDFRTPRGLIKNLVGSFSQPSLVLIDPLVLRSLPARQYASGLAEAVKTALLFDAPLFEAMENSRHRLLAQEPRALEYMIAACVGHKARVVMQDEYDTIGKRALLNLGHTFGHAVESAGGFKWLHGECVAFGICCAIDLSAKLGLADPALMRAPALLSQLGLPVRLPALPLGRVMRAMSEDKKFEAGPRFVLPLRIGKAKVVKLKEIRQAEAALKGRLGR